MLKTSWRPLLLNYYASVSVDFHASQILPHCDPYPILESGNIAQRAINRGRRGNASEMPLESWGADSVDALRWEKPREEFDAIGIS